jgi:restriction system protein
VDLSDINTIEDIDRLHWKEFEKLIALLFSALGYETEQVGAKDDHGADVIARSDGSGIAIQVKHVTTKRHGNLRWVGEKAVRAALAAKPMYDCSRGIVVTNSTFAPGTDLVARANGIELWDRDRLASELELARESLSRDPNCQRPTCVLCGQRVSPKVAEWCLERPEEFGGRVYCFEHQRKFDGVLRLAGKPPEIE